MKRVGLGLVAFTIVAFAAFFIWQSWDSQEYPDSRLGTTDPASLDGGAIQVDGTIVGVTTDLMEPWVALVEIEAAYGKTTTVAVNKYTSLDVNDFVRSKVTKEPDTPVPYVHPGLRLSGTAKRIPLGLLSQSPSLILDRGVIAHPAQAAE